MLASPDVMGRYKTKLERTRLTAVYLKRLRDSRRTLDTWDSGSGVCTASLLELPQLLDDHLARFVCACFERGTPSYIPRHAVLHVLYEHPHLRRQLPRTWDSFKSWHQLEAWKPRVPFTEDLADHVFLCAVELSMSLRGQDRYCAVLLGALIRIGFYGLLRPGEFLSARVRDFVAIRQRSGQVLGVLAVAAPKTRSWYGRTQFASIREAGPCLWLEWLLAHRRGFEKLWPRSDFAFRKLLQKVLWFAGLSGVGLTPGSCRPGGGNPLFLSRSRHGTYSVLWSLEVTSFFEKLYPRSHELYCLVEAA